MDIDNDLQYLAQTDVIYSKLQSQVSYGEDMLKHIKGIYISKSQLSVSKATEDFYASDNYKNQIDKIGTFNLQLLEYKNKRATAILRIDVWRTLEASRRKGNI